MKHFLLILLFFAGCTNELIQPTTQQSQTGDTYIGARGNLKLSLTFNNDSTYSSYAFHIGGIPDFQMSYYYHLPGGAQGFDTTGNVKAFTITNWRNMLFHGQVYEQNGPLLIDMYITKAVYSRGKITFINNTDTVTVPMINNRYINITEQ